MIEYNHHNLRALRCAAGLTQEQLGDRVDKVTSTIVRYERGSITPSAHVLGRLASVLGVSVEKLFDNGAEVEL